MAALRSDALTIDALRLLLRDSDSVERAAELLVGALEANGIPYPSLYLELGGRLRCQAQRGYWQVLDGIPIDRGIIGRTFRSGVTVVIDNSELEGEFLAAAPDLTQEICVPIWHGGSVVGALNSETTGAFAPGSQAAIETAAAVFGEVLGALGGPPHETPAQLVARLASELSGLDDEAAILDSIARAATQVSKMETAGIVVPVTDGVEIAAAVGPLANALGELERADLGLLYDWVAVGTSLYSVGTEQSGLRVHGRLHDIGVGAVLCAGLTARGQRLGMLLCASGESRDIDGRVVSSMEVLGTQAATSLLTARVVAELTERSRRDPMTGLGHHATFNDYLAQLLAVESDDRHIAVLLIDVDGFKTVNDTLGHSAGDEVLHKLVETLGAELRDGDELFRLGGDEFVTALQVGDAGEAAAVAARLLEAARRQAPPTVSIGVAVRQPGDDATRLLSRADAAMYDAKRAGRDTLAVA